METKEKLASWVTEERTIRKKCSRKSDIVPDRKIYTDERLVSLRFHEREGELETQNTKLRNNRIERANRERKKKKKQHARSDNKEQSRVAYRG